MNESGTTSAELQRLRWRARRGMRELDQLLERWLARCWADAPAHERALFERLLDCEDDVLWSWCLGHAAPSDAELAALIHAITRLPP